MYVIVYYCYCFSFDQSLLINADSTWLIKNGLIFYYAGGLIKSGWRVACIHTALQWVRGNKLYLQHVIEAAREGVSARPTISRQRERLKIDFGNFNWRQSPTRRALNWNKSRAMRGSNSAIFFSDLLRKPSGVRKRLQPFTNTHKKRPPRLVRFGRYVYFIRTRAFAHALKL